MTTSSMTYTVVSITDVLLTDDFVSNFHAMVTGMIFGVNFNDAVKLADSKTIPKQEAKLSLG